MFTFLAERGRPKRGKFGERIIDREISRRAAGEKENSERGCNVWGKNGEKKKPKGIEEDRIWELKVIHKNQWRRI